MINIVIVPNSQKYKQEYDIISEISQAQNCTLQYV